MDVNMPVMDGIEATKAIKKYLVNVYGSSEQVIVVACTAYVFNEKIDEIFQEGMDDYISKPVEKKSLQQLLSKHSLIWPGLLYSGPLTIFIPKK